MTKKRNEYKARLLTTHSTNWKYTCQTRKPVHFKDGPFVEIDFQMQFRIYYVIATKIVQQNTFRC